MGGRWRGRQVGGVSWFIPGVLGCSGERLGEEAADGKVYAAVREARKCETGPGEASEGGDTCTRTHTFLYFIIFIANM